MSTLALLSPAAAAALDHLTAVAVEAQDSPIFGSTARLTTLVIALVDAGGTREDLDQLIALDEPALAFLNGWHAATVWAAYAPIHDLVPERTAA